MDLMAESNDMKKLLDMQHLLFQMILETSGASPKDAERFLKRYYAILLDEQVTQLDDQLEQYGREFRGEVKELIKRATTGRAIQMTVNHLQRRRIVGLVFITVLLSLVVNILANLLYDYFIRLPH